VGKRLKKCIVCEGKDFEDYSPGVIRCKTCGLVVASEIPTEKEIAAIYQQDYFFGMEYFDYQADRPALEGNFRQRMRSLSDMIKPEYSVVEIGCAYGYFLNLIKDKTAKHIGFDVTKDGVDFARKEFQVNATTDDFMKKKIQDNSVDSVFMWDVVEHLTHPDEYFDKIAKILKPGGRVAMTTGNVEALIPRIRKGKWRMIHPPTHVYYFSPETLTKLLSKYGLTVTSVRHPGVRRNAGSVFNQLIGNRKALGKSAWHLEAAYRLAKSLHLDRVNVPLNTLDIMELVAVKDEVS
jgi:2-polyprenyl-3-methyl-5-hydroxy-6-metoxy-1,4-benzoquinol methylase